MQPLVDIISETSKPLPPLDTSIQSKLPNLDGIKCVLFDVYGTLMVSGVGDISHSKNEQRNSAILSVTSDMGVPVKPKIENPGTILKSIILEHQDQQRAKGIEYPEVDIREVWLQFISECCSVKSVTTAEHPLVEELSLRFELLVNPTWPMPYLNSVLIGLEQSGITLGIVSNAQFFTPLLFNAYLKKTLDELGFKDDLCQWSYFYKEAKPSEQLYQINADLLQRDYDIQPSNVLYVGNDMLNDITPAHAVGFKTALFAGDERSLRIREDDERVKGVVPDLIVKNLDEIVTCIL